jgi:hypothetical protein
MLRRATQGVAQGASTRVVVVGDKTSGGEDVRSVRLDRRPKTLLVTGMHPDIRCGDRERARARARELESEREVLLTITK